MSILRFGSNSPVGIKTDDTQLTWQDFYPADKFPEEYEILSKLEELTYDDNDEYDDTKQKNIKIISEYFSGLTEKQRIILKEIDLKLDLPIAKLLSEHNIYIRVNKILEFSKSPECKYIDIYEYFTKDFDFTHTNKMYEIIQYDCAKLLENYLYYSDNDVLLTYDDIYIVLEYDSIECFKYITHNDCIAEQYTYDTYLENHLNIYSCYDFHRSAVSNKYECREHLCEIFDKKYYTMCVLFKSKIVANKCFQYIKSIYDKKNYPLLHYILKYDNLYYFKKEKNTWEDDDNIVLYAVNRSATSCIDYLINQGNILNFHSEYVINNGITGLINITNKLIETNRELTIKNKELTNKVKRLSE